MDSIVVQKYGGSSVADVAGIKRVAARIVATRAQGKQVCVVVSAMGKTTDELLSRARAISPSPSRRELDMLLTCGERASMALVSMAVNELGYEALSFTGSQSGIITNDRHSGARIIEVRPYRIQDELERGRVVIVAGFQGVSYKREITTLGRGGSDTTAVALAAALAAEYCEICSDVDGVYTADPRIVPAAKLLEAISHDEMLELAAHGAKVLQTECVEFARRSGIALFARATAKNGGGTLVDREERIDRPLAADQGVGVTGHTALVRVRTSTADEALAVLAEAAVALFHVDAVGSEAELWFGLADVPDWPKVRERLAMAIGPTGRIDEGLGAVTVVGPGLGASATALAKVRGQARSLDVTLEALSTSPLRVTAFCARGDVERLIPALHQVFCE